MSDIDLKAMGERIAERRKVMGLTQELLAERMDVSIQMISNLERGIKAIKIDNLVRLSRILNVTTDYILTGERSRTDISSLTERIGHLSDDSCRLIEVIVSHLLHEGK